MNFGKRAFKSLLKPALIVLIAVTISANYRPIQEKVHNGIYWVYEQNETIGDALFEFNRTVFNGTEFDTERLTKHAIYSSYPSVVMITTRSTTPGNNSGGTGTGFFTKIEGNHAWVVTNNHVIGEAKLQPGKWAVTVNTAIDMWTYDAEIIGVDEIADIAVLKITKQDNEKWETLEWEDPEKIGVGSPVTVVGHGMSLPWTSTSGIISYAGRFGTRPYSLMLQIDAVINQGNSGGPVIGSNGKVVGVAQSILSPGRGVPGWDGVGMAVSSAQAQRSIDYIMSPKYASTGYVPYAEYPFALATFELKDVKNIDREDRYYAYFDYSQQTEKTPQTVGQASGLKQGDILLEINREPVRSSWGVLTRIVLAFPGDEWNVKVRRDGKDIDVKVVLREMDRKQLLTSLAKPSGGR
jgi:serine protease Do